MHSLKKIVLLVGFSLFFFFFFWVALSRATTAGEPKVGSNNPILVGPPDVRFWTTYTNARRLFPSPPVICRSTVHDDELLADDALEHHNKTQKGIPTRAAFFPETERHYDMLGNEPALFFRLAMNNAPWMGKNERGYYLKMVGGDIVTIGRIAHEQNLLGNRKVRFTKGLSSRELWTGANNGSIYRIYDNKMFLVGQYLRRWVTPAGADNEPALAFIMSKSTIDGSPWIGEFGGKIYVDTASLPISAYKSKTPMKNKIPNR